jgi:hypothetical protein
MPGSIARPHGCGTRQSLALTRRGTAPVLDDARSMTPDRGAPSQAGLEPCAMTTRSVDALREASGLKGLPIAHMIRTALT